MANRMVGLISSLQEEISRAASAIIATDAATVNEYVSQAMLDTHTINALRYNMAPIEMRRRQEEVNSLGGQSIQDIRARVHLTNKDGFKKIAQLLVTPGQLIKIAHAHGWAEYQLVRKAEYTDLISGATHVEYWAKEI